jgi:hypothetical protein
MQMHAAPHITPRTDADLATLGVESAQFSALDFVGQALKSNELAALHQAQESLAQDLAHLAWEAIRRIPEDTNLHELHGVLNAMACKVADIAKRQPSRAIESASDLLDSAADEINDSLTDALMSSEPDDDLYARDRRALLSTVGD